MSLKLERREGFVASALDSLYPLTAPVATKYLFWRLNDEWTVCFDNSILGTDATTPSILSARLHTDALRVAMSNEELDRVTGRVTQYGATILEFHSDGNEVRHVFAANDGGKWKFGQVGEPLPFENTDAYIAKPIKHRFTHALLLSYLREFGVNLEAGVSSPDESGIGFLLTKQGKLPALVKEPRKV